LLLVCLSMLALFSVTIVTYLITSRQVVRSAASTAKIEQYGNPPQETAHRVMLDLLRGSRSLSSPFRYDSLLEDLYGNDHVFGRLVSDWSTVQPLLGTGNQIYDLTIQPDERPGIPRNRRELSPLPSYYGGAILTFTTGPAAGRSTRILEYHPAAGGQPAHLYVQSFDRDSAVAAVSSTDAVPRFIINGRPNNGTGLGYNPTTGLLDYQNQTVTLPQVLLPKYTPNDYRQYEAALLSVINSSTDPMSLSLNDEGYDAVDHHNMFLAMQVPTPGNQAGASSLHERTPTPLSGSYVPVPSYHRPDLINYWAERLNVTPTVFLNREAADNLKAIARRVSFRPVQQSPRFHAMNPRYEADPTWNTRVDNSNPANPQPLAPPWDVDNDGDGLTDSVWIDPGYPVQTGPDGRLYKPLVAILCTDLDGRLNLNAHGSFGHLLASEQNASESIVADNNANFPRGAAVAQMITLFGLGFGPADVNLSVLFSNPAEYRRLLQGASPENPTVTGPQRLPGRYGEMSDNDQSWRVGPPGQQGPQAGLAGVGALLRAAKWGHYPHRNPTTNADYCFADFASDASSYGTVPDMWGVGFVGLDYRGHPQYRGAGGWNFLGRPHWDSPMVYGITRNNPYQFDLSRPAARASAGLATTGSWSAPLDAPFTVYELEHLLRYQDRDAAALPSRIAQLAFNSFYGTGRVPAAARKLVTTDSWDLPSPSVQTVPELAGALPGKQALSVIDLLKARMQATAGAQFNLSQVAVAIRFYFSPEMLLGQKFNLNRPFGDGIDSNGNGVVDEPIPTELDNDRVPSTNPNQPNPYFIHNNGQTLAPNAKINGLDQRQYARQIYARQLYVLAMLVCDGIGANAGNTPQLPAPSPNTAVGDVKLRTARALAQWAVNVVDFCDRDSIMTYFEYDPLPFTDENGDGHPWDVDGRPDQLNVNSGVLRERRNEVWGCERPELLITETLAFHNRRTKDDTAHRGRVGGSDPSDEDTTIDQVARPQGNLIIELYNPQAPSDAPSRDLYTPQGVNREADLLQDGAKNNTALNLAAFADTGLAKTTVAPVWRLAIPTKAASRISQAHASLFLMPSEIERVAYFVNYKPQVIDDVQGTTRRFFLASRPDQMFLLPGHYAVVAPSSQPTAPATTKIFVGERVGDNDAPHLEFLAAGSVSGKGGLTSFTGGKPVLPVLIAPVMLSGGAVNILSPSEKLRFSISEPHDGYKMKGPENADDNAPYAGGPDDVALDFDNELLNEEVNTPLSNQGSTPARRVCLQRLANPLIPFDQLTNPYITVDSMIIDLAVFSSDEDAAYPDEVGAESPAPVQPYNVRQRGLMSMGNMPNVWQMVSTAPAGGSLTDPLGPVGGKSSQTFGFVNHTYGTPSQRTSPYKGEPEVGGQPAPFPWFPWNNRPFTSHMELLLVPRGNPASMLLQHTVRGQAGNVNPYTASANQPAEFGHLMGFLDSSQGAGDDRPVQMHRLLEFVHAPSRFAGTETILESSVFGSTSAPGNGKVDELRLRPPFNVLSRYREPGKVNINTVFSLETWRALLGAPTAGRNPATDTWVRATYDDLVLSRRGFAPQQASNDPAAPNQTTTGPMPSYTSNPFRSYSGAHLGIASHQGALWPGVESTLLRSTALSTPSRPFASEGHPRLSPRNSADLEHPYRNSQRNPYFRYQLPLKLGSTTTTRSNVFAVWLTVGYFEAEPVPSANANVDAYPDGYWLGAELGADTGQINRHRAFYIIDRTQPTAFEPGEDHNAEQTILLRRMIE
jgi:hypothetical protein